MMEQNHTFKWRYLLSFGSNKGERKENCLKGLTFLLQFSNLVKASPVIETEPLKSPLYSDLKQAKYMNMICDLATDLEPSDLYKRIVLIEDELGHSRSRKWLPRHLDIDILLWAKNQHQNLSSCEPLKFNNNSLEVPHEDLLNRNFILNLGEEHLQIERNYFKKSFSFKDLKETFYSRKAL